MVVEMNCLSMDLVSRSRDCVVPIITVVAVTNALNLFGSRPFIESLLLLIAVVIFATFLIDVLRGGSIKETIESHSVQRPLTPKDLLRAAFDHSARCSG